MGERDGLKAPTQEGLDWRALGCLLERTMQNSAREQPHLATRKLCTELRLLAEVWKTMGAHGRILNEI